MKIFVALALLATFGLLAEANLKPLDIIKPVDLKYTAPEWQEIATAQKSTSEYYPNFKKGTEPQPEYAVKDNVPLDERHRITGGITASCAYFPWLAGLIIDNAYFCSGSLISLRWVLTAAHCVGNSYQIKLGGNQYGGSQSGSQIVISSISIVHSQYNENTINSDIALIQLPSAISFSSYISPVRLRYVTDSLDGKQVLFTGRNNANGVVCFNLTVINNTVCANIHGGSIITSTKLCVSPTSYQTTCNGCSGGPLVYLESDGIYTQVGILSFSSPWVSGYLLGFTRVTSYLSWIESITGIGITQ